MDKKVKDAKEATLIARKYLEETTGMSMFYFETKKSDYDEVGGIWTIEVEMNPLYLNKTLRYKFEIDSNTGDIKNVKQIERVSI